MGFNFIIFKFSLGGVCSLRLQNNIRLSFLPCSLSQNGTTVQRGQIPLLLYSIEEKKSNSLGNLKILANPKEDSNSVEAEEISNTKSSPFAQLFIQIMRLLAQKLSSAKCMNFIGAENEQMAIMERKIASQLVGYANGNLLTKRQNSNC